MNTYGDVKDLVFKEIGHPRLESSFRPAFCLRVMLVTEFFRAEQGLPLGIGFQSVFDDINLNDIKLGPESQHFFDDLKDWYSGIEASSMKEKSEREG